MVKKVSMLNILGILLTGLGMEKEILVLSPGPLIMEAFSMILSMELGDFIILLGELIKGTLNIVKEMVNFSL